MVMNQPRAKVKASGSIKLLALSQAKAMGKWEDLPA
jgi:hypothetical protein